MGGAGTDTWAGSRWWPNRALSCPGPSGLLDDQRPLVSREEEEEEDEDEARTRGRGAADVVDESSDDPSDDPSSGSSGGRSPGAVKSAAALTKPLRTVDTMSLQWTVAPCRV